MIGKTLTPERIIQLLKEEEKNTTVTYCAIHPDWSFTGTAEDGHYAFIRHKEECHGHTQV